MDSAGSVFGGSMAGGSFDVVKFITKPTVIARLISLVFSVIVFSCIVASGGWYYPDDKGATCKFGNISSVCGYGEFVAIVGVLICIAFLLVEIRFDQISSVQLRRQLVMADLAASGIEAFFYFVAFCTLVNKWTTSFKDKDQIENVDSPQAAIAFCFFSTISWGVLIYFCFRNYQEGAANAFAPSYEQDFTSGPGTLSPYDLAGGATVGPGSGTQAYQEPPFTEPKTHVTGNSQYQQPTY